MKKFYFHLLALGCVITFSAHGKTLSTTNQSLTSNQAVQLLTHTFESQLYTLDAKTAGHYGLRMYRQSLNPKYRATIWSDMARVASELNYLHEQVNNKQQAINYGISQLQKQKNETTTRSKLRYKATQNHPEYLFLMPILADMARADEYGLKYKNEAKLKNILRQFDFKTYATDPAMIKAWAAQIANQVYWLKQLGEQDVVDNFITAFQNTYPNETDSHLSDQQYANKIYGMTHIIFAASGYYQTKVDAKTYAWIYDYFEKNIDQIILRTKDDVINEVGISFLLAGLNTSSVVKKTKKHILGSVNPQKGMIPSIHHTYELAKGEHRNVLAIMLLDWQGVHQAPNIQNQPDILTNLPYGLIKK